MTGSLFVILMWLISVKERKGSVPSLDVCRTHDLLDVFPQSIVNSSSTILHSIGIINTLAVYALVLHLSYAFTLFAVFKKHL